MTTAIIQRHTRTGTTVIEHLPLDRLADRMEQLCKQRTAAVAKDRYGEEVGWVWKHEDTGRWCWMADDQQEHRA